MKKIMMALLVSLSVVFAACEGGDYNDHSSHDYDPDEICGNGVCGNGETHQNCPADCDADSEPVCGNGICENGENERNCFEDCGTTPCTDANENGVCDDAEYIGIYCYSNTELDAIYGDTVHYGQFSSPSETPGVWEAENDVPGFIESGDTICFTTPRPLPEVEHGYESLYADVTAGPFSAGQWIGFSVAPKSINVLRGNTITSRPILPYFAGMGYHACLDEEQPLCWTNLCTISASGVWTCYDDGVPDSECGLTKTCQTCVLHCRELYNILLSP
ncbi:hypothetical protein JW977_01375 [Candidatus Falkowbacteria bacterium]|nr:hypothetical protein [Candidatus Falkowbacteria bacterium]